MEKRRVSIFVAGQRFNILTDEEEKYVIDIAAKIDARISSLAISQNMTRERAAVLTALDYADDNEQDKRALNEIKEQIKDYLTQISKLSEENTALRAENDQLKREIAALRENQNLHSASLADAQNTKAADEKEKEALKAQIRALKEQMELVHVENTPAPQVPAQEKITAEDDLFFEPQEEEVVKPAPRKEKKNRHEHNHDNPYKQQFMKKNEEKGYTQQRQYSLFEDEY